MKIRKINRKVIRELNVRIAEEAKVTLGREGVRLSLVCAILFVVISAALGWLLSSLLFGTLQLFSVPFSDLTADIVTVAFIYLFVSPAIAGLYSMTASAYRGDNDLSEILAAFTSLERLLSAYLGALLLLIEYGVVILLLYAPDIIIRHLGTVDGFENLCYPIAYVAVLLALLVWAIVMPRLNMLAYFLCGSGISIFKTLRKSGKKRLISLGITWNNILYVFLTVATLFILLIFHTGPLWALQNEIAIQRGGEYLSTLNTEKLRKDGQDK